MESLTNFLKHTWPTTREHERRTVDTPLQMTWNGTVMRGWCNDLCLGGLGFTVAAQLNAGDRLDVEFQIPDESEPVQTTAVLRWSDGFHHGCEFLKVTAEDKKAISRFLSKPDKPIKNSRKH